MLLSLPHCVGVPTGLTAVVAAAVARGACQDSVKDQCSLQLGAVSIGLK
jgi:hypothetical protein